MNSVHEEFESTDPRPWWRRQARPSALVLATTALEGCRRDQLHHAQLAEYEAAMVTMLKARETRLVAEIRRLSSKVKETENAAK